MSTFPFETEVTLRTRPDIAGVSADHAEIALLREVHLRELDDVSIMEYRITGRREPAAPLYRLLVDGETAGYGVSSGEGMANYAPANALIEFFLLPEYRPDSLRLFRALVAAANLTHIAARSSDTLLTLMLYDACADISASHIYFRDGQTTHFSMQETTLRPLTDTDLPLLERLLVQPHSFPFHFEDVSTIPAWLTRRVGWILEKHGETVGIGAAYDHYNAPYVDIGMVVYPAFQRQGYGAVILQELKRIVYTRGGVPVARCQHQNIKSRLTLQKAGFVPNARLLTGAINERVNNP